MPLENERPKLRIYITGTEGPVYIPACCSDPSPEVHHRTFGGDTTHQQVYCASCDTDLLEFRWRTRGVEELFEEND